MSLCLSKFLKLELLDQSSNIIFYGYHPLPLPKVCTLTSLQSWKWPMFLLFRMWLEPLEDNRINFTYVATYLSLPMWIKKTVHWWDTKGNHKPTCQISDKKDIELRLVDLAPRITFMRQWTAIFKPRGLLSLIWAVWITIPAILSWLLWGSNGEIQQWFVIWEIGYAHPKIIMVMLLYP